MRNPGREILEAGASAIDTIFGNGFCEVCALPIDAGYLRCHQCHKAGIEYGTRLADRAAFLTYAVQGTQSYRDMFSYKNEKGAASIRRLRILVRLFIGIHSGCFRLESGKSVDSIATVPSGRGRVPAPLEQFVELFPPGLVRIQTRFVGSTRVSRAKGINPAEFEVASAVNGRHILLVEDSWATGNNAQSMAIRLKDRGADRVSILCIARLLNRGWAPRDKWIASAANRTAYDPLFCPVSRSMTCPS